MAYRGSSGRRGSRSHPQSSGTTMKATTYDATLLAADRVLSKEAEYIRDVRKIHASACMLASKIAVHGDLQKSLTTQFDDDDDDEEGEAGASSHAERFLTKQRTRLKELSAQNARRQRDVEVFLRALGAVRDDVRAKQQVGDQSMDDDENDDQNTPPDYTQIVRDKMNRTHSQNDVASSFSTHAFCQEMRARLGEKEPRRASRSGGDADDEELEVIPTQRSDILNLKCPITGTWFEKPLRNKICKHTVSAAGFAQMLRTRKFQCPVYGCANTSNWTRDQLEDDFEMEMRVTRYLNQMKREQESQNQMSDDEYEDQENGNEGEGDRKPRMTIIE